MELFQKLTMLVKDKFLKNLTSLIFFLIIFFIITFVKNVSGEEISLKINNYIKNLNLFSSKFVQSNGVSLEEGYIYIKGSKIRLDYFYPERTLIFSNKKGVYINHELREEEFFSTEKNIIKLFYDIFLGNDFFSSSSFKENNGEIVFEKSVIIDSDETILKIFFENKPLLLRKIIAQNKDEYISISFNEHNYNNNFEKDFFSFVPMYLD